MARGERRVKSVEGVKENAKNNTPRIACLFFQNVSYEHATCVFIKKLQEQGAFLVFNI